MRMEATDHDSALDARRDTRVLVVDDHPSVRTSLTRLIAAAWELQLAGAVDSGEAAIEACRAQAPDVVLMDMRLPGIDGVETTRRLTAEHPGLPIVMLTSLASPRTIARAISAGAAAYLFKDDPIAHILTTIREVGRPRAVQRFTRSPITEQPDTAGHATPHHGR